MEVSHTLIFLISFYFWNFYKAWKLKQILSSFKGIFLWFKILSIFKLCSTFLKISNAKVFMKSSVIFLSLLFFFFGYGQMTYWYSTNSMVFLFLFFNLIVEGRKIWILNVFVKNTKKYQPVELEDYWPIESI